MANWLGLTIKELQSIQILNDSGQMNKEENVYIQQFVCIHIYRYRLWKANIKDGVVFEITSEAIFPFGLW